MKYALFLSLIITAACGSTQIKAPAPAPKIDKRALAKACGARTLAALQQGHIDQARTRHNQCVVQLPPFGRFARVAALDALTRRDCPTARTIAQRSGLNDIAKLAELCPTALHPLRGVAIDDVWLSEDIHARIMADALQRGLFDSVDAFAGRYASDRLYREVIYSVVGQMIDRRNCHGATQIYRWAHDMGLRAMIAESRLCRHPFKVDGEDKPIYARGNTAPRIPPKMVKVHGVRGQPKRQDMVIVDAWDRETPLDDACISDDPPERCDHLFAKYDPSAGYIPGDEEE